MRKLIFILFLFISTIASAKTIYLATDGDNGNPGTLASPYGTMQYAVNQLRVGDTLYIRGGTYNQTDYVDIYGYDGTESDPICVFAYPDDYNLGNKPIFDLSGINPARKIGAGFWIHDIDWWIFQGLSAGYMKQ